MNMKRDPEVLMASWLDEGPARLPVDTRQAIVVGVRTMPRRPRGFTWPIIDWRRQYAALAGATALVLVGVVAFGLLLNGPNVAVNPSPAATASPTPPTSGGRWPQTTLEEVRAAQAAADAGDPAYTWQVDPRLFIDDSWAGEVPGHTEFVGRFLREVLGWEEYTLNPFEGMARDGFYDVHYDQHYLRCAPGRTNPLYPPGPEPEWGEQCAPTLDGLHYESVSLDLAQPDRKASDGIWVVTSWRLTAPFAQADPVAVEAQAMRLLEEFLAARVAGARAGGRVRVDPYTDVPLLYATTSGARYERYEIERLEGPHWPHGHMLFSARLFADAGSTVVEQEVSWRPGEGLTLFVNSTAENGHPVIVPYTSTDGEVSVSVPSTWGTWSGGGTNHGGAPGLWFWEFYRGDQDRVDSIDPDYARIEFTDPVAYDAWCADKGGNPLLSAPADASEIAEQILADPDLETTAPVVADIGGFEAVSIDVSLAPGGKGCGIGMIVISRWIHTLQPGLRLRLYLVDLPEGMSVDTLAITVVAPEERFEQVIGETAPIIESIEFHAP